MANPTQAPHVQLRDVAQPDLPTLFKNHLDPTSIEMAAYPPRDQDAFTAHWTEVLSDPSVIKKTILVGERVAGYVVSFDRNAHRQIGYWLGKEFWGQGIATQAVSMFLDHETARPLTAYVAVHNSASIRVLQKCGFAISGRNRAAAVTGGEEVEEVVLKLP